MRETKERVGLRRSTCWLPSATKRAGPLSCGSSRRFFAGEEGMGGQWQHRVCSPSLPAPSHLEGRGGSSTQRPSWRGRSSLSGVSVWERGQLPAVLTRIGWLVCSAGTQLHLAPALMAVVVSVVHRAPPCAAAAGSHSPGWQESSASLSSQAMWHFPLGTCLKGSLAACCHHPWWHRAGSCGAAPEGDVAVEVAATWNRWFW